MTLLDRAPKRVNTIIRLSPTKQTSADQYGGAVQAGTEFCRKSRDHFRAHRVAVLSKNSIDTLRRRLPESRSR